MDKRQFALCIFIVVGSLLLFLGRRYVFFPGQGHMAMWLMIIAAVAGALVYAVTLIVKAEKTRRVIHMCCYVFTLGLAVAGIGFVVSGLFFGTGFTPVAFIIIGVWVVVIAVSMAVGVWAALRIHKYVTGKNSPDKMHRPRGK